MLSCSSVNGNNPLPAIFSSKFIRVGMFLIIAWEIIHI
jgi:hypothetical protein